MSSDASRDQLADYNAGVAFVDGQFIPIDKARIPLLDWGFLHSDATYDVVHVWKGSFFRLADHLDRFERSAARMRLTVPYAREQIQGILANCVRLSGLRDAYVEVICTRGVPLPGSRDPRQCRNSFSPLLSLSSGSFAQNSKNKGST